MDTMNRTNVSDILEHAQDILQNGKTDLMYINLVLRLLKRFIYANYTRTDDWLRDPLYRIFSALSSYRSQLLARSANSEFASMKQMSTNNPVVTFLAHATGFQDQIPSTKLSSEDVLKLDQIKMGALKRLTEQTTSGDDWRETALSKLRPMSTTDSRLLEIATRLGFVVQPTGR